MVEVSSSVFFNVFLYLLIPFLIGLVLRRFNISPIIGYIVAGILLGNFFDQLVNREMINNFAYFGMVLLLFTIGLEVNLEQIFILKKFIITGGLLQIGLSILSVFFLSNFFDFNLTQSLLIGIAFASSSTALVAKIIQERGEESSFVGELAIGILMLQDLAFIPAIIIFSFFHNQSSSVGEVAKNIALGMAQAAVILSLLFYVGRKIIPLIFDRVVRTSRELLNLLIILFIFLIGYLATLFHVPILIGMFVAGILVSQTLEHHHIFSQVRPFRDILAIIFFIYIGTHIQITEVLPVIPKVLLFTGLVIFAKLVILLGIFTYLRFSSRLSFTIAIFLFQISESAFILLSLAYSKGVFNSQEYLTVISSVLLSLIITPVLIGKKEVLYSAIRTFFKTYVPAVETFIQHKVDFDRSPIDTIDIKNHVVLCGYGRIGTHIGRALMVANIPFIAVDYNYHAVLRAKKDGIPIIYADPTDVDILDYAQTEHAIALVIAIPDKYSQEAIILNARKLNQKLFIISRVHKSEHGQRMKDLGANVIVQPELEASLSIIKKLMLIKQLSREDIVKKLHHFKVEHGM